jgi:hypothetical protein
MAAQHPRIHFEDVPLEEARRMGRGPHMGAMLYHMRRHTIPSLSTEATRIHLSPEISPPRMKRYLQSIARALQVPVTVRLLPGGVRFWRSTEEDQQQSQEIADRL